MAVEVTAAPVRLCDVWSFTRMRSGDVAEVEALGLDPIGAVLESWAGSREAWTIRFNGEVAAMYGAAPQDTADVLAPVAVGWLLTTEVVDRYPVTFYKECARRLPPLARRYGMVVNFIDARYERALRWARRLGFLVQEPIIMRDHLFYPVVYGG